MILETHERLGNPKRSNVSRVVVYDNFNNAVVVMLQIDERTIDVRVKGQPGFDEALRFLGIRQTVVVDVIHGKELPLIKI